MKSEKATAHKLKREAKKGKSLNLKDLTSFATIAAGSVALLTLADAEPLRRLFRMVLDSRTHPPLEDFLKAAASSVLQIVGPAYLAVQVVAALLAWKQGGGVLATEALAPDLSRLNPVSGLKNLISVKVLKEGVKAILLMAAATFASMLAWHHLAAEVFAEIHMPARAIALAWSSLTFRMTAIVLATFLPLIALSSLVEYITFSRSMRMDKSEVKQEHKENDGNPEVKKARRELAVELSNQVKADVRGSDVILANPTHIAVGIWLHSEVVSMPFVSVHEKGARAQAVIAYATKMGIPVVRDIPLARAIHARSRRYSFLNAEDIDPVVRLLRWLRDVERAAHPDNDASD